jgi:hypothetical protein
MLYRLAPMKFGSTNMAGSTDASDWPPWLAETAARTLRKISSVAPDATVSERPPLNDVGWPHAPGESAQASARPSSLTRGRFI